MTLYSNLRNDIIHCLLAKKVKPAKAEFGGLIINK